MYLTIFKIHLSILLMIWVPGGQKDQLATDSDSVDVNT